MFLFPTAAAQIQRDESEIKGSDITVFFYAPENVLYKPLGLPVEPVVVPDAPPASSGPGTSLRAARTISESALRQYLQSKSSPLADHAHLVLSSPYWSTLLGICHIEQYSCSRLSYGTNWNLWGIMRPGGGLEVYATAEEGLAAINAFLHRAETVRGRPTIESFRGWYCVNRNFPGNVCPTWESVVLKVKAEVEAL